jgi:hypothetical protein
MKGKEPEKFRVMYLVRAIPDIGLDNIASKEEAEKTRGFFKRQGYTAWVETTKGEFVPVKGAARKPGHL